MSDNNYSGLWIPLVTPLHHDAVDHAALSQLVLHLKAQGIKGFVACGSTGEAALLDAHEQDAVLETVCEAAGGTPVMMGVSGPRPAQVAARMLAIAKCFPVRAFLLPAPSYIRPSQQGLLNFFGSIADVAPAPLVLYDIPYRTGVKIELPTLLSLAAHPNIEALKEEFESLDRNYLEPEYAADLKDLTWEPVIDENQKGTEGFVNGLLTPECVQALEKVDAFEPQTAPEDALNTNTDGKEESD